MKCAAHAAGLLTFVVAAVLPATTRAADEPTPAWRQLLPANIEQSVCIPHGDNAWLALLDAEGRLHILDAHAGELHTGVGLDVGRGARCVVPADPDATPALLCYDRYAVTAVALGSTSEIQWTYGERPPHPEQFPHDPERLSGWIDAAITVAGVVAVNSDGRCIVLDPATGDVRWQHQYPPLAVARLHVHDTRAALLFQRTGVTQALFIDVTDPNATADPHPIAAPWPLWSALVEPGLLLVAPLGATLVPPADPATTFKLDLPQMRAGALAVYEPARRPPPPTTAPAAPPPPSGLLIVGAGPRPIALDLRDFARVWPQDRLDPHGMDLQSLRVVGERVIALSRHGAGLYDVHTGQVLVEHLDPLATTVVADVIGPRFYSLHLDATGPVRLWHTRVPAASSPDARAARQDRMLSFPTLSDLRTACFAPTNVIFVGARSVVAYQLPINSPANE